MEETTIAAIATPAAISAVGIVRVSGSAAGDIASRIFCCSLEASRSITTDFPEVSLPVLQSVRLKSHRLYHGYILDNAVLVDEVLLALMRAPNSYTGEDVLEIYAHGGPVVLQTILSLIIRCGAEMAAPGEFTRRAYMNGKMDLTQAEAVADIIDARSQQALYAAADQMSGSLKVEISRIRAELLSLLADFNAEIEFGDQFSDAPYKNTEALVLRSCERVRQQVLGSVQALIERHDSNRYIKKGVKVALAGKPNAGKSTLLNRLLGRDRAIVSATPGTTRDVLEEAIIINGMPFVFYDTAGIGAFPRDDVERVGQDRAREAIVGADAVVFLVDVLAAADDDIPVPAQQENVVVAVNKIDLVATNDVLTGVERAYPFPVIRLSALTGEGVPVLKQHLSSLFPEAGNGNCGAIPNPRHRQLLVNARQALESMLQAAREGLPADMLAMDLQAAINALDEISGAGLGEDVLDSIFERFCVGK